MGKIEKHLPYLGIVVWWTFMINLHNFHGQNTVINWHHTVLIYLKYKQKSNGHIQLLYIDFRLTHLYLLYLFQGVEMFYFAHYRNIHFSMPHIWNFSIYYDLLIIKYHLLIIHLFLISYIFIIIWANGPRARANVYSGKRTRNHFRRGTPNSIHRYLNSY